MRQPISKLKYFFAGLFIVTVWATACVSSAFASIDPSGGGEVPSPFSAPNQVVELASGETYSLVGTVVSLSGSPYFKVDFDQQPWLQSSARIAFPFYPLEGGWSPWQSYLNSRVRISVTARGVVSGRGESARYTIFLKQVGCEPVVFQP